MKKTLSICLGIFFALALTLVFLPTMLETPVSAATSGTTGACTWTLDDEGILTISGNGAMGNYTYSTQVPWRGSFIREIVVKTGVTHIGNDAFLGCTSLTSINIPDSVTSIGDYAFYGCTGLTSITIPDSVTSIDECVFGDCPSLTSIQVSAGNSVYHSQSNCLIETASKTLIAGCKTSEIPSDGSVTSIGNDAFLGCTSLTSINIPDSVTSIGDYAFWLCTDLTTITIPEGVTSIGFCAFDDTAYYNNSDNWENGSLYIGNCLIDGTEGVCSVKPGTVLIAGGAFFKCYLNVIIIPNSVKYICQEAFYSSGLECVYYCGSITDYSEIVIASDNEELLSVPWYYNASINPSDYFYSYDDVSKTASFLGCDKSVSNVVIPSTIIKNYIEYQVTSIAWYAFFHCDSLESVIIPDSVTSIGYGAFLSTTSLSSIVIDENNSTYKSMNNCVIERSSKELVLGCKTSVIPSDGSATRISSDAFANTSLTSINIPNSITTIGDGAFSGCSFLTDVWYEGTQADRSKISIDSYNTYLTDATWHYVDNACDTICNECGIVRAITHNYKYEKDNIVHWKKCSVCREIDNDSYAPHDYSLWDQNETEHWIICPDCGTIDESTREDHDFDNACDTTCDECGCVRQAHTYDNACDTTCNICGETRTTEHYTIIGVKEHTKQNSTSYPYKLSEGWYQSTNEAHSSSSTYTITANHACTLTLNYKVSSQAYYDKLTIKKNSSQLDSISGIGYAEKTLNISLVAGDQITITYSKNGSSSAGADCGWFKYSCDCILERQIPSLNLEPTCTDPVKCSICGAVVKETLDHSYTNNCDTDCDGCGFTRTITHVYDHDCDAVCNVCHQERSPWALHSFDDTKVCKNCNAPQYLIFTINAQKKKSQFPIVMKMLPAKLSFPQLTKVYLLPPSARMPFAIAHLLPLSQFLTVSPPLATLPFTVAPALPLSISPTV